MSINIKTHQHPDGHRDNSAMSNVGGSDCGQNTFVSIGIDLKATPFQGMSQEDIESQLLAFLKPLDGSPLVKSIVVEIGTEQDE